MTYSVEAWDPSYGTSSATEEDEARPGSRAEVVADLELPEHEWRAIAPRAGVSHPPAVLFVDGVRRVDSRIWIDHEGGATLGLCASYASGVVLCRHGDQGKSAVIAGSDVRRGLFTTAVGAQDIPAPAQHYRAHITDTQPSTPLPVLLSSMLQQRLAELEITTAVAARERLEPGDDRDLLVIDGPLRGRQHLPRTIGYIKTHHSDYLPPELNQLVARLEPGQRTPVFRMGTNWERHSWYLRLPYREGAPWAGIVRVECSADLTAADAIELAYLSQAVLVRYASSEIKDPRAPQNLYPIAGLEKELRRRLGNPQLLHRALRTGRGR
ncbi:DNA double-strand break repair nuclease NurA [Kineosporia corallincola]